MHLHPHEKQQDRQQSAANPALRKRDIDERSHQTGHNQSGSVTVVGRQNSTDGPAHVKRLMSLQQMANNSPNVKQLIQLQAIADSGLSRQGKIIQMTIWRKTNNGVWKPVNDGNPVGGKPNWMGGKDDYHAEGTMYDDKLSQVIFNPQDDEKSEEPNDPASKEREILLAPYIKLKPHIEGELKNGVLKGGHLLLAMRDKWRDKLTEETRDGDDNAVWELTWSIKNSPSGIKIKGNKSNSSESKQSTMFPASWTWDDLVSKLRVADRINGYLIIDGIIKVRKNGDTFYPESNNDILMN